MSCPHQASHTSFPFSLGSHPENPWQEATDEPSWWPKTSHFPSGWASVSLASMITPDSRETKGPTFCLLLSPGLLLSNISPFQGLPSSCPWTPHPLPEVILAAPALASLLLSAFILNPLGARLHPQTCSGRLHKQVSKLRDQGSNSCLARVPIPVVLLNRTNFASGQAC